MPNGSHISGRPSATRTRAQKLAASLSLALQLTQRDVAARYRGSLLGVLWSLVTPLMMLAVYTWVFGTLFPARWPAVSAHPAAEPAAGQFALLLFPGLILFGFFAETVSRSPGLILSNANLVKKVVFPLELLPVVTIASALCNAALSVAVLLAFLIALGHGVPATALMLPIVLLPFAVLTLGLAWFFSALGVYIRDVGQLLGPAISALMFLSPIFYPVSAVPESLRAWIAFNPLAFPIETVRGLLIWGRWPDWSAFGIYSAAAVVIALLGFGWFEGTRKGFADVV